MKRIVTVLGLGAVFVIGAAQLATSVKAEPTRVLCPGAPCALCPPGYVLSPTPGHCCRCVKAH